MILARDVMTANPMCIAADSDIHQAAEFFLKNFVSSVPVKDDNGNVLGQLHELGLMRALVRTKVKDTKLSKVIDFKDQFAAPEFVFDHAEIPLVVSGLMHSSVHRVLVKNSKGYLVGIISPKDVLRALLGDEKKSGEGIVTKLGQLEAEIQKLNQNLKDATSSLDQYASFAETGVYMVHSADRDGKILMANTALKKNLGYDGDELIGKNILDIYAPYLQGEIQEGLRKIMKSGYNGPTYSTFVTKKGKPLRIEIVSSAINDAQGKFIGTFTISRTVDSDVLLRALHGVLDKP